MNAANDKPNAPIAPPTPSEPSAPSVPASAEPIGPIAPPPSPEPAAPIIQARPYIDVLHIRTGMPIVCSENGVVGIVDRVEGKQSIKVDKDRAGHHHYIPISWVSRVDKKIHLDRSGEQAKREWSKTVLLS